MHKNSIHTYIYRYAFVKAVSIAYGNPMELTCYEGKII